MGLGHPDTSTSRIDMLGAHQVLERHETPIERFEAIYRDELEAAVRDHPEEYTWPIERVPSVAQKMIAAIRNNTYNKDGRAIKATCKRLGVKHTYTAIAAYLGIDR